MRSNMIIDIIFFVGGKGGFEQQLNRTADYLSKHNITVRFIQIINTHYEWATKSVQFVCLDMDSNVSIDESINRYAHFLSQNGYPSVIFGAGMPITNYIAKKTLLKLNIISCPTIAWPHNDLSFYNTDISSTQNELNFSDYQFAISENIANSIHTLYPDGIIYQVNNAIDPKSIVFNTNRDTNTIVSVGRLSPEKNLGLIIEAISKTKSDWKLILVGEGDEKERILTLSNSLNVSDKVQFLNWQDNPWKETINCRALVISSLTEAGPLSAIEALSCGMPVISTPVGIINEIITPGVNGYIYESGNSAELANILDMLDAKPFNKETAFLCKESAKDFLPETALWDFLCKLVACSRLVGLPQRHWQDTEKKLIKLKASVIISDAFIEAQKFLDLLAQLTEQTIERQYLEIIIVHSNYSIDSELHSYEQKNSDIILLIECDSSLIHNEEEAYRIGMQYASGDMYFYIDSNTDIIDKSAVEVWYMDKLCGGNI